MRTASSTIERLQSIRDNQSLETGAGSDEQTRRLEQALALGWQLLNAVEIFAGQLQFSDLGVIELPPPLRPAADQATLQAVPPLYLAAELEAAHLLPAVETLAGIFISGGLQTDLGAAGSSLFEFWQNRRERFSAQERQAFFARLFGYTTGPPLAVTEARNTQFETLMIDLTEALYKLDPTDSVGTRLRAEVPLRLAAHRLADNLIRRSGGVAAFAARDILRSIEAALAILKERPVQQAVGGHSVWQALSNINRSYLAADVDVAAHVIRARSGMHVLAWLTEIFPQLDNNAAELVSPDHPVIADAVAWLQASLTLAEQQTAPPAR